MKILASIGHANNGPAVQFLNETAFKDQIIAFWDGDQPLQQFTCPLCLPPLTLQTSAFATMLSTAQSR